MEDNKEQAQKDARKAGGLLFAGCMFMGMAAGWYFGNIKIGLFGGMGLGFIMMAVVTMSASNKR